MWLYSLIFIYIFFRDSILLFFCLCILMFDYYSIDPPILSTPLLLYSIMTLFLYSSIIYTSTLLFFYMFSNFLTVQSHTLPFIMFFYSPVYLFLHSSFIISPGFELCCFNFLKFLLQFLFIFYAV